MQEVRPGKESRCAPQLEKPASSGVHGRATKAEQTGKRGTEQKQCQGYPQPRAGRALSIHAADCRHLPQKERMVRVQGQFQRREFQGQTLNRTWESGKLEEGGAGRKTEKNPHYDLKDCVGHQYQPIGRATYM